MILCLLLFVLLADAYGNDSVDLNPSSKSGGGSSGSVSEDSEYLDPHVSHKDCLKMKKVFYGGRCWDLLTRGPCEEGQCSFSIYYSFADVYRCKHGKLKDKHQRTKNIL